MIGTQIGNFEVIRQIGKGGMGEVWLAEQKDVKTKVAIKMLLPQISADKQQVLRFFNEAVTVSKIKHAGITKIFDVGVRPTGEAYLVMEYLDGESLAARIARVRRLRLRELADITRQIASVLEATHIEGITHRDLKPDNLFLVPDTELSSGERVKVLDFGIAKLSGGTGMTGSGAIGTPLYMSPEQWKTPAGVDGRADVYSLGCLVFEMACGRPPFIAASIGEACTMHLGQEPPLIRSRVPSLPEQLEAAVASMLAKDPNDRMTVRDVKAVFGELETLTLADRSDDVAPTLPPGDERAPIDVNATTAATVAPSELPALPISSPVPVASTTLGSTAGVIDEPAAPRTTSRWTAIALGVVAIAGAGVAFVVHGRGGDEPSAPEPTPPAHVATPVPAPPPTVSHVHISATPANAKLQIDDAVVSNPFTGEFPRNDLSHHITTSAPGFQIHAELVTFDKDRDLAYDLVANAPEHREKPRPLSPPPPPPPPAGSAATVPPIDGGATIYKGTKGALITNDPAK